MLEQSFARELGIRSGDRVKIATPAGVNSLTVSGTAVTLGRGPYPGLVDAVAWVLPETLTRLVPDPGDLTNGIAIRVANPDASTSYASKVNALFPNQQVYGNDDWHEMKSAYNRWNQLASVFFGVFSVFAMLAVALIIANAIGGRVLAQYREIGLIKAIGFTPGQVMTVFLVQHLLLGLVGATAGIGSARCWPPSSSITPRHSSVRRSPLRSIRSSRSRSWPRCSFSSSSSPCCQPGAARASARYKRSPPGSRPPIRDRRCPARVAHETAVAAGRLGRDQGCVLAAGANALHRRGAGHNRHHRHLRARNRGHDRTTNQQPGAER